MLSLDVDDGLCGGGLIVTWPQKFFLCPRFTNGARAARMKTHVIIDHLNKNYSMFDGVGSVVDSEIQWATIMGRHAY
jgi:hypothetical protein